MSNIENKIRQHQKDFDNKEPGKDHLARFILRLEADQDKLHHRRSPWTVVNIAAAFLLLAAVSYFTFSYLINGTQTGRQQVQVIEFDSEMLEIMAYYDAVSLSKIQQIDGIAANSEEADKIRQTAYNRLEDIDISLAAIEKEYLKNPGNSMLKAALINNKRKKVEVMERIILQIDFANVQLY